MVFISNPCNYLLNFSFIISGKTGYFQKIIMWCNITNAPRGVCGKGMSLCESIERYFTLS